MSGRVIYYYERTLTSQVNNIEHLESQSLPGYGVVKIFFQPTVNINAAMAQVTADRAETAAARNKSSVRAAVQRLQRADPATGIVQQIHPSDAAVR